MRIVSADIYDVSLYSDGPGWNPVILRLTTDEGIYGLGRLPWPTERAVPGGWGCSGRW